MGKNCGVRIDYGGQDASLFSWTQAMQCWSWSIPAGKEHSCPMFTEGPGSVCESCYAMSGRYVTERVLSCQLVRLHWTKDCMKTEKGRQHWIKLMSNAIYACCRNGYFRVHDSGDFFSKDYIEIWYEVCRRVPSVKFWFPTRAWIFPGWLTSLRKLNKLKNVSVRPSALFFNKPAPAVKGLDRGSGVVEGKNLLNLHMVCPKSVRHTSCEEEKCRHCWDSPKTKIAYIKHGYEITDKIKNRRKNLTNRFTGLTHQKTVLA